MTTNRYNQSDEHGHDEPVDAELDLYIQAARNDTPDESRADSAQHNLLAFIRTGKAAAGEPVTPRRFARSGWPVVRSRRTVGLSLSAAVLLVAVLLPLMFSPSGTSPARAADVVGAGDLRILGADGQMTTASCPLKHTWVDANITGFLSRTIVRQRFTNPQDEKIEAVYVFPLPLDSAVDSLTLTVGERRIVGVVKAREEARAVYDAARKAGHVAALLDQERPNIFTQSVANIEPGAQVDIEISYVETLKSESGKYQYVFPMTVAPRYIPGRLVHLITGETTVTGTTQVPDASRITPPGAPASRAGHEISVRVFLDAGTEIFDMASELHTIDLERDGNTRAIVSLRNQKEIPNRDFVLNYRLSTDRITDAFLTSSNARGSFFTLMLQPPKRVAPTEARPKEMIFLIDRSGSMSGLPIEKAKETMGLCIQQMNPNDTFNLLSFSGGTGRCFEKPVANNEGNRTTALSYLEGLHGSGGTEMMPAIMEVLSAPADPQRVRIVCFMTDGEIGNDFEIIDAVKKHAGTARVFAFGIGNSVNRFLLDAIAREGRGEVEYVMLNNQGAVVAKPAPNQNDIETHPAAPGTAIDAARRFAARIASPVLTDIIIDWGKLPVTEVYPKLIPDLFSEKPILIHGRLTGPATGSIWLRGNTAAGPFERQIHVTGNNSGVERRDALDSLWSRAKVDFLMHQDLRALQHGNFPTELKDEITSLGVAFSIVTQFTSFVAVDQLALTRPGESMTESVPVETPDGQVRQAREWKANFSESDALYDSAKLSLNAAKAASGGQYGIVSRSQAKEASKLGVDAVTAARKRYAEQQQTNWYKQGGTAAEEAALSKGKAEITNKPAGSLPGAAGLSNTNDAAKALIKIDTSGPVLFGSHSASQRHGVVYDPSDGTVSRGDVWRVKADGPAVPGSWPAATPLPVEFFGTDTGNVNSTDKLAIELRPLLEWQKLLDADGNSSGTVQVQNFRVRVRVVLKDIRRGIMAIRAAGFEPDRAMLAKAQATPSQNDYVGHSTYESSAPSLKLKR